MPRILSDAERRSFLDDGYVQLPQLVPQTLIEAARKTIDADLVKDRSLGRIHKYLGDTFCPGLLTDVAILNLFDGSPVRDVVSDLFGAATPFTHEAQIAIRFPEYAEQPATHPPHIDGFPSRYNTVEPSTVCRQTLLVGVYLSRIEQPYMGNFLVWSGSHKQVAENYRAFDAGKFLADHDPSELAKRLIPTTLDKGIQIVAEPGDIVLAHGGLVHSAAYNLSLQLRYAVYFRVYLGVDDPADPAPFGEPTRFFERISGQPTSPSPSD